MLWVVGAEDDPPAQRGEHVKETIERQDDGDLPAAQLPDGGPDLGQRRLMESPPKQESQQRQHGQPEQPFPEAAPLN